MVSHFGFFLSMSLQFLNLVPVWTFSLMCYSANVFIFVLGTQVADPSGGV